ncbi:hypothetical protein MDA_GLEAN10020206 [Myotis davidii]|uniref:Uncharacterized protein n=1 Tax=Myotis davidii TaxID=225400 RepID=L5LJE5_MYODS|nr:hypothetical protein MDA_GLEAN10020206 [Myotis davidii]
MERLMKGAGSCACALGGRSRKWAESCCKEERAEGGNLAKDEPTFFVYLDDALTN